MKTKLMVISLAVVVVLGGGLLLYRSFKNSSVAVQLTLGYQSDIWPPPPAKFFLDGREIASFANVSAFQRKTAEQGDRVAYDWFEIEQAVNFAAPLSQLNTPAERPKITGQILTPCGWIDGKAYVKQWLSTLDKPLAAVDGKIALAADMRMADTPIRSLELFVDNRGGADARLELGQSSIPIAKDSAHEYEFPAPSCAEATSLKLNGQEIAQIPLEYAKREFTPGSGYGSLMNENRNKDLSWSYLLDTSGKRCYQLTEKTYVNAYEARSMGRLESDTLRYSSKVLHHLVAVEVYYFLERAPDKVKLEQQFGQPGAVDLRVQVLEVPCH
jgi:hypothetical protein